MARPKSPADKRRDTHSFRVDDDIWKRAQDRAREDNMTVSKIASLLVEGYATGKISVKEEVTFQ